MKKIITILFVLTIISYGCSEHLNEAEINSEEYIEEKEKVAEKSDTKFLNRKSKDSNLNPEQNSTTNKSGSNFEIYEPEELIVYVDYTDAVAELGNDEISPNNTTIPLSVQINNLINDYEIEMSNNFTIFQITESNSCNYIYKWVVDKNEYNEFWGSGGFPEETTIGGVKQKKKKEDNDGSFFNPNPIFEPDPYADCF